MFENAARFGLMLPLLAAGCTEALPPDQVQTTHGIVQDVDAARPRRCIRLP